MIRKIVQLSIDPNLCNRTKYCVSEALAPTATTTDVPDADATARAEDVGGWPMGAIPADR